MSIKSGNTVTQIDENRVFITFEAVTGQDISFEASKELITIAAEAGADSIKFQLLEADKTMGEDAVHSYKILVDKEKEIYEDKEEGLREVLKRRELKKEEWIDLKYFADKKGLKFFCTALFPEDVDFLVNELNIDTIKIASGDINNLPFMRYVSQKKVSIQIDTGSGNIWEIERAVRVIEEKNRDIVIHHCPTGYPAKLESINLNMIPTLKLMFPDYTIAFSDHSPGWDMDIAAIALGAKMVEKTITLDRTTPCVEHCFSLEPHEAGNFVKAIRDLEIALGRSSRVLPPSYLENRKRVRRSVFTRKDLTKGDELTWDNITFRRPGYGISPPDVDLFIGKKVKRDILEGQMLNVNDIG